MSAGRIVLLVFGIIFLLVALAMIAGGGTILAFEHSFKDAEGYYTTNSITVKADSYAVVTSPADIHIDYGWIRNQQNLISIKATATNNNPADPVFIGIAPGSDLENYLSGVSYDEVSGFSWPDNLSLSHYSGDIAPSSPATQSFWIASTSGSGTQTLQWNIANGNYSLVLMNANNSAPINADVSLGVRIPRVVFAIGLGILIGGILILIAGGVMVFFAAKGW